jgi:hypothetical protein
MLVKKTKGKTPFLGAKVVYPHEKKLFSTKIERKENHSFDENFTQSEEAGVLFRKKLG